MLIGHSVDCASHSLGPCILSNFPFGTCNVNTRKREGYRIRGQLDTRSVRTDRHPCQVRRLLHNARLDPDDILTFQAVKLVPQEP